MNNYQAIIGLEVHVQLKTKSKMFCGCSSDYRDDDPNTHCCPVCLGLPGALPVPNKRAIEQVLLMGLALNCQINRQSYFARKNYFYPDLPKGYQITQYDKPFCYDGKLVIKNQKSEVSKNIGITRIHLEEDTGKSMHVKKDNEECTLLDFNKSGIPLMELVTEPDFHDSESVWQFAKKIRQIVRYLDISDGDMEKGQLRVEPNISVKKPGETILPQYKVEIKNLNSFSALKRGIEYEIERQINLLEQGEIPKQETRGWNEDKQETFSQRSKEESHDYRYFPEPDIPPITLEDTKIQGDKDTKDGIYIQEIKKTLVELPDEKIKRLIKEYDITFHDAEVLTEERELADWFEQAVTKDKTYAKKIANWIISELLGNTTYQEKGLIGIAFQPEQLAKIVTLVEEGKISRISGKEILTEVIQAEVSPLKIKLTIPNVSATYEEEGKIDQIIKNKGLEKVSDEGELVAVIEKVITTHPKPVADYQNGKKESLQFLIGQVMKETRGKADVGTVKKLLEEKLQ